MVGLQWVAENWFVALSATGVIGGLLFNALSLRSETKTRKTANLLALTANHREVWKEQYRPELARITDASVNPLKNPITPEERAFVSMVILQTSSAYETLKEDLIIKQERLQWDIGSFFSLPIPLAVWEKAKIFQNRDFVAFVDKCRREAPVVQTGIPVWNSPVSVWSPPKPRTRFNSLRHSASSKV